MPGGHVLDLRRARPYTLYLPGRQPPAASSMDFSLTEQQKQFCDAVASFARKELAEGAIARAHAAEFPREVARKMAGTGLLGITIAEADGGSGGTLMDAVLAIEQVAKFCPRSADAIA